jgi:hypothetical protein
MIAGVVKPHLLAAPGPAAHVFHAASNKPEGATMRGAFSGLLGITTASLLIMPAASQTQTAHQQHGARLGTVEFKVECTPAAQADFNTAMALYHSFDWPRALVAFPAVAAKDPACGMAHWGVAMSILDNPFVWPAGLTPQKLDGIVAALDKAQAAGLKSKREQDYVAAVGAFVRDHATRPYPERIKAFDAAMAALMAAYPDDTEAKVLSALITSANFNPADKNYTNQLKAAAILEPLFKQYPDHPGVAHYLIHSYDYPPIAEKGLEAAKAYAAIAPDAAHALHMPSHIFTRVGYWKESIAANRASAKVSGDRSFDGHHASDYLVYAYLQLAQDKAAREAMMASFSLKPIDHFGSAFAYAAMPARLYLESGDWEGVSSLALTPKADGYPWQKYPHAEAINAYARGIGAARKGDAAAARAEQTRLVALRDKAKEAGLAYWAGQIDIQAGVVSALALCAEGKTNDCITELRAAAAREDATEKHVVTPGPLLPARELLADTLMMANKPVDALAEYEAVMKKEPNRYRTVAGAMAAAKAAGEEKRAKMLAAELVKLGAESDTPRDSLGEARRLAGG